MVSFNGKYQHDETHTSYTYDSYDWKSSVNLSLSFKKIRKLFKIKNSIQEKHINLWMFTTQM